ncbi:tRNA (adenosine(37)-N6)-dimethylallyltransferase MiaA [Jeotgalibaca sp. MA1X17-3]|uniref:tRNA (adenosine(37)-N6)-dimethylallyltransferase MiaA n=1 Tax=Jeotgalibaca sp. MA1X17-3 TaxID=2908211 RepID=UPI001F01064A|nr:tRNA (adenosine(37)-N6)-dimethylallyltransferase MiaA [Jeotgalibaca sp. MA1X17-3]UJF14676.1 tRNA (adenosine(37)-N6)-dimethylallyltransferase MiaA [Jeotgalibaca sp. MA1X17-3]
MRNIYPKLIVVVGPTAVGKTSLAIRIAKQVNGEVINGDSMQVYKGLDIGTAKVTEQEKEGVPHHLIDILDVTKLYTANDFKTDAEAAISLIQQKGKIPILAGGSGLYIEGLLYDMEFGRVGEDPVYRSKLQKQLDEEGPEGVWEKLNQLDPVAATALHVNNSRRVIRALESIQISGKLFSEQNEQQKEKRYDALVIGLTTDRPLLYQRINERVDQMIEEGLLEEAKLLFELKNVKDTQSYKGIGYKEWFPYFEGEISFEAATEKVKQNSRKYAKRQLTWFRNRMDEIQWFDLNKPNSQEEIDKTVEAFLKAK